MNRHKISYLDYPLNIQILFFNRYAVDVPSIALRSYSELRERGVYAIDDDEDENLRFHEAPVETSLTVNRIFEIWQSGYAVNVLKMEDTVIIFNAITLHLQQWVGYLNQGIQIGDAPFEDLVALDAFADKVYIYARHERAKKNIPYFANAISNSLGFDMSPSHQLGQQRFFTPLGESDRKILHLDPKFVAKEERETFSTELSRLGGKMSAEIQEAKRESLFSHVSFNKP